ncbi:MAG: BREX-2 system adenine-specific DNA-methyltransferase PglX, partial [bacterium]
MSVTDSPWQSFHKHPWSIGGGGAAELKEWLEKSCSQFLEKEIYPPIGRAVRIGEEEAFIFNKTRLRNSLCPESEFRAYLIGENVRDWGSCCDASVWYPYVSGNRTSDMIRQMWTWRTFLANRSTFQGVMADAGFKWFHYMQHTASAYETSLSIAFAFVATHNHFVLDRGGKVFKQSAPVIKLPPGATEDEHLALLGLLNSSTACFWMKQVTQIKTQTTAMDSASYRLRREFDGTKLKQMPIPKDSPLMLSQQLDAHAQKLKNLDPISCLDKAQGKIRERLLSAREDRNKVFAEMMSLQEELDWKCYQLYQLLDEDLNYSDTLPLIQWGQRAFEILMARQIEQGELETTWFEWHGVSPIVETPSDWPEDYKQLVEKRIEIIQQNKSISLIEQPEYKRRWEREPWESQLEKALESWLLDRLERYFDL